MKKIFDAVESSRRWRRKTSRFLRSMSSADRIAFFLRHAFHHRGILRCRESFECTRLHVVGEHRGDERIVMLDAPLAEAFAHREKRLPVRGIAGEVGHLTGIL